MNDAKGFRPNNSAGDAIMTILVVGVAVIIGCISYNSGHSAGRDSVHLEAIGEHASWVITDDGYGADLEFKWNQRCSPTFPPDHPPEHPTGAVGVWVNEQPIIEPEINGHILIRFPGRLLQKDTAHIEGILSVDGIPVKVSDVVKVARPQ